MNTRLLSFGSALLLLMPTFGHGDVFNCADGDVGCLIDAINVANVNGEDDTIELAPGGAYTLTAPDPMGGSLGPTGLPAVKSVITIVGRGATIARSTGIATPDFRVFFVHGSGHLILDNVSVRYGRATGVSPAQDGGGIRVGRGAKANLIASIISDNSSSFLGGGIFVDVDSTLVLDESAVVDNQAVDGGGIFLVKAVVEVNNSIIAGNSAEFGGGIFNDNGGVTHVVGSTISRNTARRWGGGIGNFSFGSGPDFGTRLTISDTTLSENFGGDGGAIYCNTGAADIRTSTISNNSADYGGSAISNHTVRSTLSLYDSCIVGNPRSQFGNASVLNDPASPVMDATDNWWGAADGPSGVGAGSGDAVSTNVNFVPFRSDPAPACSATTVPIDIKPNSADNVINPRSKGRFWAAILSAEDFDALRVDPASVRLGAGGASPDKYRVRDSNHDGVADLLVRFRTPSVGIVCGDTSIELTGQTYDGVEIVGEDDLRTVGCKKPKPKKKGKKK